jgi:hypothetical protein
VTAISSPPWWRVVSALLATLASQPAATPVVECALTGDPAQRVYQIIDGGSDQQPRWLLRLTAPALGQRHVDLPLANATPVRRDGGFSIASASANGGATVQIHAAAGSGLSTVNVFVNYELEVNVWRDLSPDVEHMNTHGVPAPAQCRLVRPEPIPYP